MVSFSNGLNFRLENGCGYSEKTIDLPYLYWPLTYKMLDTADPTELIGRAMCVSECPTSSTMGNCRIIDYYNPLIPGGSSSKMSQLTCRFEGTFAEYDEIYYDTKTCKFALFE